MKRVAFLIVTVIIVAMLMVFGCKKDNDSSILSTYPTLNGKYSYSHYEQWGYVYERLISYSYRFDNTRKTFKINCSWSYTEHGWTNPSKSCKDFDYEWKVERGKYYERLWNNPYDNWKEYDFEMFDDGNIRIGDKIFKQEL